MVGIGLILTGTAQQQQLQNQLHQIEQALLKGAGANGFTGELWSLDRITKVIERLTRVHHHPAWVWALLHYRLG
jgi:transposase